jgi:hypothetical protein
MGSVACKATQISQLKLKYDSKMTYYLWKSENVLCSGSLNEWFMSYLMTMYQQQSFGAMRYDRILTLGRKWSWSISSYPKHSLGVKKATKSILRKF